MVSFLIFDNCPVTSNVLESTCLRSLCQCSASNFLDCMCEAADVYSRLCTERGARIEKWRSENFCGKSNDDKAFLLEFFVVES